MSAGAATGPARVALIGANGHGMWHRRRLAPLHEAGRVELVGLADTAPVTDAPDAPIPAGARVFSDHRELLAQTKPDVVVICTPPHTHLAIASDAARAGADLLLEKPPVTSTEEHHALARVLLETSRVCQVGFQALGSLALARLCAAVSAGELGVVTGVSAVGSWQRSDAYYARAPWAGRRSLNGQPALDGALANPFAHALMQCLAIAAAADGAAHPRTVEVDAYHTRPIEVEDTACLRVMLGSGIGILVGVTLCGEEFLPGEITVHGSEGRARLEYPTDRLAMPGDGSLREVPGRVGLLENLLDHRADPAGVPLLVPLVRTAPFTAVVEVIRTGPPPNDVPPEFQRVTGEPPERHHTIVGINEALIRAGERLALLCEQELPWTAACPRPVTLSA